MRDVLLHPVTIFAIAIAVLVGLCLIDASRDAAIGGLIGVLVVAAISAAVACDE